MTEPQDILLGVASQKLVFLGIYFLYQLVVGGYAFVHPEAGGGVAYFAHLGGIAFGLLTVRLFGAGRPRPRMGF